MKDIYIVGAARTAVGSFNGSLAGVSSVDLGKTAVVAALQRAGVPADAVDEVIMGCVLQAGLGQNITRQVLIAAGIPQERCAQTVNMVCGSGLRTVAAAAQAIVAGDSNIVVAGGTENMSLSNYLLPKARSGYRMGHAEVVDSMVYDGLTDSFNNYHMGITAENLAAKYQLSREDQDVFSATSQQRAEAAITSGRFKDEIAPVVIPQRKGDPKVFDSDEFPRFGSTVASLSKLRPAFKKDGTVTAGNASGVNDGAAAVVVAGDEAVQAQGLTPLARIASYGWYGCDPAIMGIGPVEASRIALKKAGWSVGDLDLIEANEGVCVTGAGSDEGART